MSNSDDEWSVVWGARRNEENHLTCSPKGLSSEFLSLWKSYLFSCLTKLAKLECLNIRGRTDFVNSFISLTMKDSPLGPQDTMFAISVSSSILYFVKQRKRPVEGQIPTCKAF